MIHVLSNWVLQLVQKCLHRRQPECGYQKTQQHETNKYSVYKICGGIHYTAGKQWAVLTLMTAKPDKGYLPTILFKILSPVPLITPQC